MSTSIKLTQFQAEEVYASACKRYQLYSTYADPLRSSLRSYLIGRLGEVGAYYYLKSLGFKTLDTFLLHLKGGDVQIEKPHLKIEVKTWITRDYPSLGHCLPVGRLAHIFRSSDLVMYCSAAIKSYKKDIRTLRDFRNIFYIWPPIVWLEGYSYMEDFEKESVFLEHLGVRSLQIPCPRDISRFLVDVYEQPHYNTSV